MSSVWKRLQRMNKTAAKYSFTASYHELMVEGSYKWQPNRLCVVWTRRNRRHASQCHRWEPTVRNPNRGLVIWPAPEKIEIKVTLFKDPKADIYEDKEWTFVIEDITAAGHHRSIASASINMKQYASSLPHDQDVRLSLRPMSNKVAEAYLLLSITSAFLYEGKASGEDMQSIASLMSMTQLTEHDIGNLDDFEEENKPESHSKDELNVQISSLTTECKSSDSAGKEGMNSSSPMHLQRIMESEEGKERESGSDVKNKEEKTSIPEVITAETQFSEEESEASVNTKQNSMSVSDEMLAWCKQITKEFSGLKVTNLTTSFRNGMAFCAIIQHFRPDLICLDSLSPHDIKGNCKKVFNAAATLGIPRLIEPSDMVILQVPDKLAVLTYLYELRSHFTGKKVEAVEAETIGSTSHDSTYIYRSQDVETSSKPKPTIKIELTNSLNSDGGDKEPILLQTTSKEIKISHSQEDQVIKEQEPQMMKNVDKPQDCHLIADVEMSIEQDDERQKQLRVKAKKSIAEVRKCNLGGLSIAQSASSPSSSSSSNSVLRMMRNKLRPYSFYQGRKTLAKDEKDNSAGKTSHKEERSLSYSVRPMKEPSNLANKLDDVAREHAEIDIQGIFLEQTLRTLMELGSNKSKENRLMQQWLDLVKRKNDLICQQIELNIIEKEEDLKRRFKMLNKELRVMIDTDDCKKTEADKTREQLLLDDLVSIVNKRDELVKYVDTQEKAIPKDENTPSRALSLYTKFTKVSAMKKRCTIQ